MSENTILFLINKKFTTVQITTLYKSCAQKGIKTSLNEKDGTQQQKTMPSLSPGS